MKRPRIQDGAGASRGDADGGSRGLSVARRKPKVDLEGRSFGRWTVIRFAGNVDGSRVWKCRCECGAVELVREMTLQFGVKQACNRCAKLAKPMYQDVARMLGEGMDGEHNIGMASKGYDTKAEVQKIIKAIQEGAAKAKVVEIKPSDSKSKAK